ncbi:MAG: transcriptional regulator NrdR [Candidatus Nomurabacteria bacterium]|jgi:transcriptional repressor NrdR|nr:transcriptional regulator NrdR [Candidatus Nomurabacteria bacterium]
MHCSKCGKDESKVIESRDTGSSIRRRRECIECGNRYTTYERIERPNLAVLKTSGSRELFDREKLKRAIFNSVGKFINGEIETEEIVSAIEDTLYSMGENEVQSRQIGELVLGELAKRNEVAFIRFASVFRQFKDADEFVETLQELRTKEA